MYRNILLKKYFKFFSIAFYLFFFVSTVVLLPVDTAFAQASSSTPAGWSACIPGSSLVGGNGFDGAECAGTAINFIFSWFFSFIYYALVYPLSIVASFVFDFTVYFSVVHFRDNFSELQMGGVGNFLAGGANVGFIYYLWGIIRDVLNIIIFIMIIYHAVRSMFEGFEGTKSKFIALLVFSIITNFSLLLVKLAIDVSNILTLQAYTLGVKPSGTDSFTAFRTSTGNAPANYGEFIRNSIDLDKLVTNNSAPDAAKAEVENMQNTFMFQLGRLITMTGVIYLLLFMTGLLLARALSFLFAMILSPLLAADIFFTMIAKTNPLVDDIKDGIKGITDKIKGDFYDALIKGPLLIFFVFIIGLFAESIMGAGLMNTMNDTFKSSNPSNVPGIIGQNLFVFFKFALFFMLAKKALEVLQSVKLGNTSGKMMNKWGNAFLGRSLGGLSRLGALAGQNTIARGVRASGLSNRFADWNVRASNWLGDDKTGFVGRLAAKRLQSLSKGGISLTKKIQEGTFDAGNLKSINKLGKAVEGATGLKIADQFGKPYEKGLSARESAAADARKKAQKEDEDFISENIKAKEEDILKKVVNFDGVNMTLAKMSDVLKEVGTNKSTYEAAASGTSNVTISGQSFTPSQIKKLLDDDKLTGSQAFYNDEYAKSEKDAVKKAKDEFAKQRERSKALGTNNKKLTDYITPTNRAANKEIQSGAQAEVFRKGADKTKGKELAGKISLIKDTAKTSSTILNQINDLLLDPDVSAKIDPTQLQELLEAKTKLAKLELDASQFRIDASSSDQSAQKKAVENVSANGIIEDIIKAQDKATNLINNTTFSDKNFTTELKNAQNELARVQGLTPDTEIAELRTKQAEYNALPPAVKATAEIQKAIIDINSEIRTKTAKGVRGAGELANAKKRVDELNEAVTLQKAAISSASTQSKEVDKYRKNYETYFGGKVEKVEKPAAPKP